MAGIKSVRLCPENFKESSEYPCEHTREGTPVEKLNFCYTNQDASYKSGMWEMTPGTKYFECGVIDEICILIEGEVVITDSDGQSETYVGGQAFILPAGFKGTWKTVKPVKKYFAMHFNKA